MSKYVTVQTREWPRLPYEANLDLTYRCNNNCRHCWLWLPANAPEGQRELSFGDIRRIADAARGLGCRRWLISGGEPMLRPDFAEIFDYLTRNSRPYCLNTNGTLITPAIARQMTRPGTTLVSLYGATAAVHDHVTRHPGSFETTLQGLSYLKEAGANFMVQIVPLRDNYHQVDEMVQLALSWRPSYRLGASWLYGSASGSRARNRAIGAQRLAPSEVVALEPPGPGPAALGGNRSAEEALPGASCPGARDDRLFASCIATRRDFHIDPYGRATFCAFIKDPTLRYDLKTGSVEDCWTRFIPSLADRVRGGPEFRAHCGSCDYRADCRWCGVYGYLEHGRFSAPVEYLCAVARDTRQSKMEWQTKHRRFFQIAELTIQLDADLPIDENTFDRAVSAFQVAGPGEDNVVIEQHFGLPKLNGNVGKQVYRRPPWVIYDGEDAWTYVAVSAPRGEGDPYQVAVFSRDHAHARIYNDPSRAEMFRQGHLNSLALFPTDQIWLARLLAERQACLLHSSGAILNGKGLLFVGHSEAGKTTIATMLKGKAEILCDDRNIVRRWPDGYKVYGTWGHGDLPEVSPASARLCGLLFLEQANENRIVPLEDRREILHRLVPCLVKPFETAEWWEKELDLLTQVAEQIPCYVMRFDKSGAIVPLLEALA